jgi:hypothetical protein
MIPSNTVLFHINKKTADLVELESRQAKIFSDYSIKCNSLNSNKKLVWVPKEAETQYDVTSLPFLMNSGDTQNVLLFFYFSFFLVLVQICFGP